jgi:L-fuculose-phosphate aldolase
MSDPKQHLIEIAEMLYARFLTDSAGGNLSLRQDGLIYVTPRFMGSLHHYRIDPTLISVLDAQHQVIEGPTELSREARLHLAAYTAFPEVGSVIHAHPRWLMVFAANGRSMKTVLEYTIKFGTVECVPEVKAHSQDLADRVVEVATRRREQLRKAGMGVLLPKHGIAVLGQDVDNAFDILERLESNARVVLLSRLLPEE